MIYVGGDDGNIYAVNPPTARRYGHLQPVVRCSPHRRFGSDGSIYVGDEEYNSITGPVASHFYAVNPDGSQKWAFTTGGPVNSSPAIGGDGTVYISDLSTLASVPYLYAVNANGQKEWAFTGSYGSPVIGSDGTIYVSSEYGTLYALNPNGTTKWALTIGSPLAGVTGSSPTIGTDGTIYVGARNTTPYMRSGFRVRRQPPHQRLREPPHKRRPRLLRPPRRRPGLRPRPQLQRPPQHRRRWQ